MRPRSETNGERAAGSRALFYRPPFVSWVGHLSFVLRSLPLRSLRSLRETNGGYEWRTEEGTKTRQRRYEVKGTECETNGRRRLTVAVLRPFTLSPCLLPSSLRSDERRERSEQRSDEREHWEPRIWELDKELRKGNKNPIIVILYQKQSIPKDPGFLIMKIREKREKISEKIRVLWLRSSFTRFLVHVSLRTPRSRVALCSLRSLRSPLRGVVIGVRQWTKETCIFYLHFLSYFHFYFSSFWCYCPALGSFRSLFTSLTPFAVRRTPFRRRNGPLRGANGGSEVGERREPTEGTYDGRLSPWHGSLPHSSSLIHPLPFPLVSLPPGGRGGAGETWGMGWGWVTNGMRSRRASCLYVGRCLSSTSLTRHGLGVREGIYRDINNSLYLYISLHNKLINTRGNW